MDHSDFSEQSRRLKRWAPLTLAVMSGGIGGITGRVVAPSFPILAAAIGFGVGFVGTILFMSWLQVLLASFFSSLSESLNRQFSYLFQRMQYTESELRSMINLRPLLKETLLPFGGWAIDGRFAERLIQLIQEIRPVLVLECGSGTSTAIAAECLQQIEGGRLFALEHDPKHGMVTRRYLHQCGLEEIATVVEAPLREWIFNGQAMPWYDFLPDSYLTQKIDLLIVDGPPGRTGPMARYPAVPLLSDWFRPGTVIILDDGNRNDEKEIAKQWIDELNATSEFHPEGKGMWVIRL